MILFIFQKQFYFFSSFTWTNNIAFHVTAKKQS